IALRMLALINGYGVPGGRCQPASGVGKAGDLQDGVAQLRLDVVEAGDITSEKSFEAVVEEIVGPAFLQVRSLRVGFFAALRITAILGWSGGGHLWTPGCCLRATKARYWALLTAFSVMSRCAAISAIGQPCR